MRIAFLALLICVVVITAAKGHYFGKTGWGPHRPERPTYSNKWRTTKTYECAHKEKFREVRNSPRYLNGLQIISAMMGKYIDTCRCSQECVEKPGCGAFVVRGRICILLRTTPLGKNAYIYSRGDRFFAYIGVELLVIVFRITSGIDGDPMARYNDNSYVSSDEETISAVDLSVTLNTTYKSALLDYWNTFNIVNVGVGFIGIDQTSGLVIFDGRDAKSKYDWMDQKKLLSSPWYDLSPTTNTSSFGVLGSSTRRFNIMDHQDCSGDFLWLSVVTKDSCRWTAGYRNPEIIFSPLATGYPVKNGDPGKASTFGIGVEVRID